MPCDGWLIHTSEDRSTWPERRQECWVYSPEWNEVIQQPFNGANITEDLNPRYWQSVTHWMPIEVPEPPS